MNGSPARRQAQDGEVFAEPDIAASVGADARVYGEGEAAAIVELSTPSLADGRLSAQTSPGPQHTAGRALGCGPSTLPPLVEGPDFCRIRGLRRQKSYVTQPPAFGVGPARALHLREAESSPIPRVGGARQRRGTFLTPSEVTGLAQDDTLVSGVAGRYASALFSLAQDERKTEAVAQALARFDAMVAGSP